MVFLDDILRQNQNIIIESRKRFTVTGVKDVISFDETCIILETYLGRLTFKGEELKIQSFDNASGDLLGEGDIFACGYTNEEKIGFLSRIFKWYVGN